MAGMGSVNISPLELAQARERLELLDGARGKKSAPRAAVRIEDLKGIVEMSAAMKSKAAAGNPPTKAEYDALREDVLVIFNALRNVSNLLSKRLMP